MVSDASQRVLCEDDGMKLKVSYKWEVLLVVAGVPREGTDFPRVTKKAGGGARGSSRAASSS